MVLFLVSDWYTLAFLWECEVYDITWYFKVARSEIMVKRVCGEELIQATYLHFLCLFLVNTYSRF